MGMSRRPLRGNIASARQGKQRRERFAWRFDAVPRCHEANQTYTVDIMLLLYAFEGKIW